MKAELRGYLDGQVRSINANINATHDDALRQIDELRRQIGDMRDTLHGRHGDNGLRSEVRMQRWIIRLQWAFLIVLIAERLGLKIPMIP